MNLWTEPPTLDAGDIRVEAVDGAEPFAFCVYVGANFHMARADKDIDGNDEPYAALGRLCEGEARAWARYRANIEGRVHVPRARPKRPKPVQK